MLPGGIPCSHGRTLIRDAMSTHTNSAPHISGAIQNVPMYFSWRGSTALSAYKVEEGAPPKNGDKNNATQGRQLEKLCSTAS
jgi:hypothetical protein